jgi:hypothetical protein
VRYPEQSSEVLFIPHINQTHHSSS